jgi:phosphoribosylanthranilate isomerase
MNLQLKANAMTHLTDARYFASMEVDWLGFNLNPSDPHATNPLFVKTVREWVSGPTLLGEFNLPSAKEILSISENAGLNTLQLGPLFNYDELMDIPESYTLFAEVSILKNIPNPNILHFLDSYRGRINYYLFNFSNLSEPLSEQWKNFLVDLCKCYPIFIQSDDPLDQMLHHIRYFNPTGYCLSGGLEEKTGVKSFDELDEIFERLTNES